MIQARGPGTDGGLTSGGSIENGIASGFWLAERQSPATGKTHR
jgi:hypothetical protein